MKFLHRHAPAFPLTQLVLIFPRDGVCLDPEQGQGLTRMALRMLQAGAGGLDNADFHARIERIGASMGSSLSNDHFTLRMITLTENLDRALELFRMAIMEPNLDEQEFERIRAEMHSSWIADREESKHLRAQEVYMNRIYGGLPNGYSLDGTEAGILGLTLEAVRDRVSTLFSRAEPILGVLSNLDSEKAERRVAQPLTEIMSPRNGLSNPWDNFEPVRPTGRRITIIPDRNTQTDELIAGAFSTGESVPDWHIHRLISLIFGGDMNSRLFRIIRGERGFSYGASCWYETSQGRSPRDQIAPFTMYTFPSAEHTALALPIFLSLYEELVAKGVAEVELNRAKDALINSHPFVRDSPQKLLALDCDHALYGVGVDDEETNREKIRSVTPDEIQRVLAETHHPESLTVVMLGDPERLEPIAGEIVGVEQIDTIEYPPPIPA